MATKKQELWDEAKTLGLVDDVKYDNITAKVLEKRIKDAQAQAPVEEPTSKDSDETTEEKAPSTKIERVCFKCKGTGELVIPGTAGFPGGKTVKKPCHVCGGKGTL